MHYSIADRARSFYVAVMVAGLLTAALAYGLSGLAPVAHADGPGSGSP
jgi:hypothetical protein